MQYPSGYPYFRGQDQRKGKQKENDFYVVAHFISPYLV